MQLTDLAISLLNVVSTASIGLLVGALLTESCLLVPYWRSLSADAFHAQYRELHPRLYRYFTPLTVAPLLLSVAAAFLSFATRNGVVWPTVTAGVLVVCAAATHEIYFKKANDQFASGALSEIGLAAELAKWSKWNWVRVGLGLVALAASIVGIRTG